MQKFNDNFLRACRKEPVDHLPVWFMRQAGRYQPEYRKIKETHSIIDIIKDPDLCARVTLLPIEQLDVDAAILFSDIMTPIGAMGIPNTIKPNYGPFIPDPVRTKADIEKIIVPDFETEIPYVAETIRILKKELSVPLIGFCGAPFTLACYIVEGGKSKNYENVKGLMYSNPDNWHSLMEKLSEGMINYLELQVRNGADAIQVFDSWAGILSVEDYRKMILPHMKKIFSAIKGFGVPSIHFGVNTYHLLPLMKEAGCDVLGVDWKVKLSDAWKLINYRGAIQGNLDPVAVLSGREVIRERTVDILEDVASTGEDGFIFNLGHGVIPSFKAEDLRYIVELVHNYKPGSNKK